MLSMPKLMDGDRLTKHALGMYLDPPETGGPLEKGQGEDNKGEQLFYKLANLDDRVKNADQVSDCALQEDQAARLLRHRKFR